MKQLLTALLVFTCLCQNNVNAQSKTFENILKLQKRGSGVIRENEAIRGYFFFYKVDKGSKGNNIFLLEILDENLQPFKTTTIEESKRVLLTEGAFNGEAILLKFLDTKNRSLIYRSYDLNGEMIKREERPMDSRVYMTYASILKQNGEFNSLVSIPNEGFVEYGTTDRGRKYDVRYVSTSDDDEWSKVSDSKNGIESAFYLANSDELVFNLVSFRKSAAAKRVDFKVNAYDLENGEKVFERELKSEVYSAQPVTAYYDEDEGVFNLVGIYYEADAKAFKDNGLGLFNYKIDDEGEIVEEIYRSWAQDFRKYVTVDNDGRISNEGKNGYIYFHNIIQNTDGTVTAVGEMYNKAADAIGIAANVLLGAQTAMAKVVVRDMVIFHFTDNFEIIDARFVEKTKSDFTLPYGYGLVNIHLLSNMVKVNGGFDYEFTNENKEAGTASVGYVDYERKKGEKNEFVFGAITYHDGRFSQDKISLGKLRSGSSWSRVYPAKPGYIMIAEYDKGEKSLDLRLEKINY